MGHSGEKASLFLPLSTNFRHILSEEKSIPTGKKVKRTRDGRRLPCPIWQSVAERICMFALSFARAQQQTVLTPPSNKIN